MPSDTKMENSQILSKIKLLEKNEDLICHKSTSVDMKGKHFCMYRFVNKWTGLEHKTYAIYLYTIPQHVK